MTQRTTAHGLQVATELYRFIARHYLTSQSWQQGAA